MKLKPLKTIIAINLDEYPIAGWGKDGKPITPQIWHKHKPIGTIVSVGTDVTVVKAGDRVVVNPYAVIQIPDEKQMLIKEADILAIIEDENGEQKEEK